MSAKILDGKKLASHSEEEIKTEVSDLNKTLKMAVFGCFGFLGTLLIALISIIFPVN